LGAALFDSLAWLMFVQCFFDLPWLLCLAAVPLWASLVEARDGQTPGQQIFSLKRLLLDGSPPAWKHWWRCLGAGYWPWAHSGSSLYWVPA
jgi:hypothetical protein